MEKVDETIDALCDWIQKELNQAGTINQSKILPEMKKALAELMMARARAIDL